jgi:hypothetical protein
VEHHVASQVNQATTGQSAHQTRRDQRAATSGPAQQKGLRRQ